MIKYNGKEIGSSIGNYQPTDFSKVTAHPEFVLKGKKFYDETGRLREGTAALKITHEDGSDGGTGADQWCGEYDGGINYKTGAIVSFEGNIYICIKDNDDQQEPTNAEYWEMLNEGGAPSGELVEDSGVAYSKVVLKNASCATVKKLGGMTYIDEATHTASDSKVTEIKSTGENINDSLLIPADIQALDGYGCGISENYYNYIDFEKKQFIKRVSRVDMSELIWKTGSPTDDGLSITIYCQFDEMATQSKLLCSKFTQTENEAASARWEVLTDGEIYSALGKYIIVATKDYTDAESFKAAMSGTPLYYELETPVFTDLSHILTGDNNIEVEGGGTITMVNEQNNAVPFEIVYQLSGTGGGIIEVDALPTENIDENALYKCGDSYYQPSGTGFSDILVCDGGAVFSLLDEGMSIELCYTDNYDNMALAEIVPFDTSSSSGGLYYDESRKDIFAYISGIGWCSFGDMLGGATNGGAITSKAEAVSEGHYYAFFGVLWKAYDERQIVESAEKYFEANCATVNLPNVTKIKPYAFYEDTILSDIKMPLVTSIGESAFNGCERLALTELPSGVTYIGFYAFYGCENLALTELPSGITFISSEAFRGCTSLALTELPSGIIKIYRDTFYDCENLALTKLPSGVTSIGERAFRGCTSLALTELPSGVTTIERATFYNCENLALTELPSGVTFIGEYAFNGCERLALTELPSGVTSISQFAFYNCTALKTITFKGIPSTISAYAFSGCTNLTAINVPWAEGAVANAPWGADNATINYNHVG